LALTSPTSGGRSIGIVRLRTKATEFGFSLVAKQQYHVEISSRFAALESLDAKMNISRSYETVRENMRTSAKESLGY
jgi:hypothetical protein